MIGQPVEAIMSEPVRTIGPAASVVDAAATLNANDIGSLVVVESGEIEGILTDYDVVRVAAVSGATSGR